MSSSPNSFHNSFDSHEPRQELDSPFLNEEYLVEEARTAQVWRTLIPDLQPESPFLEAFEEQAKDLHELGEEESKEFEEALESFQQVHSLSGQEYEQLIAKFASGELESQDFIPVSVEVPGGGRIQDKKEPIPSDLVPFKGYNKTVRLHKLASDALQAMIAQARRDGISSPFLLPVSGYRSIAHQKKLWQRALKKYHSPEEAKQWVAKPGGSPHHSGRAVDLYLGGSNSSGNVAQLRRKPAYNWLVRNAERYGFYPYDREPWHWEYNPLASQGKDFSGIGAEIFENFDFINGVEEELETEGFEEFFDNLNEEESDLYGEPFSTEETSYVDAELQNSYSYHEFFEEAEPTHHKEFLIAFEVPPLLKNPTKSDPPGQTLYVQIGLGKDKHCVKRNEKKECVEYTNFTIRPMTGIFIPENYVPQSEIDLILYLHGHKSSIPGSDALISQYWDGQKYPVFALREEVNASKKNVILVAPTLGLKSEAGDLVRRNGLDSYLDKVLEALKTYGPYQGQSPVLGKLILAAHSGGGVHMRMLATLSNRYAPKIRACWGFDCMYSGEKDVDGWLSWAKKNLDAVLYSYYWRGSPERASIKLQAKADKEKLVNVITKPYNSKDKRSHFLLIAPSFRESLQNTQFLGFPAGSVPEFADVFDEFTDELDEEEFEYEGILEGTEEFEESSEYLFQEATGAELREFENYSSNLYPKESYETNLAQGMSENGYVFEFETEEFEFEEEDYANQVKFLEEEASNKSPLPVPVDSPVPFAPPPPMGSYWPVKTSHKQARIVSYMYQAPSGIVGRSGRMFLAGRKGNRDGKDAPRWHVGIDLFTNIKDVVVSCEDGTIVDFSFFYKAKSGQRTYKLLIQHDGSGVVVNYGELTSDSLHQNGLKIGDRVMAGQSIGFVSDTSMLHFETYVKGTTTSHRWWKDEKIPPHQLLNPTKYLLFLREHGLPFNQTANTQIIPTHPASTPIKPSPEIVRFAQRVLNATEGERLDDDGDLGKFTRGAFERFRRKHNLATDGILDDRTQLALAQRALEEIAQQSIFPQLGVLDAKTKQALIAFKSKRGLGFNATLDETTRVALTDALAKRIGTVKPTVPSATPTGFPKLGKSFTPPSDPTAYRRFRLTTYHMASEPITSSDPLVPILTRSGNVIANVPAGFFAEMALEGRGELKDGRLLKGDEWRSSTTHDYSSVLAIHHRRFPKGNKYHDKTKVSGITVVDDKVTTVRAYAVIPKTQAGQGYGVLRGIPLEPYRTVAADIGAFKNSDDRYRGAWNNQKGRYIVVNGKTGLVPTGTQVYIRQLDGVILPNGKRHDGWVIVNDTGGGIFGAHFDVFVGEKQKGESFIKLVGGKLVDVWFDGIEQRIPPGYTYGLM